jgi:beta-glucanase (GH16 family)
VSVDGLTTLRVVSRQLDPQGGWYTAAAPDRPQAPFDAPFALILNLAVGGDWPGQPDDATPLPTTMLVDYARVVARLE